MIAIPFNFFPKFGKNIEINMNVNVVISTFKKNFIEARKHPIDLNISPTHQ